MGGHSHARAGPLFGDVSACGESCGAWHGNRIRTLAGVCSGREAVSVLWPPASACPGMPCQSSGCQDRLGKVKPLSPVQRCPCPACRERSSHICGLPSRLPCVLQLPVPAPPAESCHGALKLGNVRGYGPGCLGHPGLFWGAEGGMVWSIGVCLCVPVCSQPWVSWA